MCTETRVGSDRATAWRAREDRRIHALDVLLGVTRLGGVRSPRNARMSPVCQCLEAKASLATGCRGRNYEVCVAASRDEDCSRLDILNHRLRACAGPHGRRESVPAALVSQSHGHSPRLPLCFGLKLPNLHACTPRVAPYALNHRVVAVSDPIPR